MNYYYYYDFLFFSRSFSNFNILPMISEPPLLAGTSQSRVTLLLVTSGALKFCGADGGAKYVSYIYILIYIFIFFSLFK